MELSWKEKIVQAQITGEPRYTFQSPITPQEKKEFTYKLKTEFPEQLLSLYEESNGVIAMLDDMEIGDLIWSSRKAVEENLKFRRDKTLRDIYAPFDDFLFFADSGTGDQFAVKIISNSPSAKIYAWDHEDDSRTQIAPTLESFIVGWITGKIRI